MHNIPKIADNAIILVVKTSHYKINWIIFDLQITRGPRKGPSIYDVHTEEGGGQAQEDARGWVQLY